MRDRLLPWLDVLGGAALVVFAPAALVAFGTRTVLTRNRPGLLWLVPWAGLLCVGALGLLTGSSVGLLIQVVTAALACLLLVPGDRRRLLLGVVTGMVVVLAAGTVERELTRRLWTPNPAAASLSDLIGGISRVSGDAPTWTRNGIGLIDKHWIVPKEATGLMLSFEMRGLSVVPGWQWYTNSPLTRQERRVESGEAFTRLTGLEGPVVRRVRMDEPLGGRTVKVAAEFRTDKPLPDYECGLLVRTFEPSFQACSPLRLGEAWLRSELEVTFPADMQQTAFEVRLPPLDVNHLDVRRLEVEVLVPSTVPQDSSSWLATDVVEPSGVHVRFPLAGIHVFDQPSLNVLPSPQWTRYTLTFDLPRPQREITALLQVESGTVVELRNLRLIADGGAEARPAAAERLDLWLGDPNLAGHGWASVGLAGQALTASPVVSAGVFLLSVGLQTLAASRTSFFAAVLFGAVLLVLALPRRVKIAVTVLLVVVAGLVAILAGGRISSRLLVLADENTVTRTEIWSVAVSALGAEPLTGGGEFQEIWRDHNPADSRNAPNHAHNLWLHLGATHGVPGVVAGIWLAAGLAILGWRWGRWRGLLPVLGVLAMNALDVTYLSAGVVYPVAIALNSLRSRPAQSGHDRR